MKVFIIESSYPKDFYKQKLDGIAARGILNSLGVKNELRFVLDREHFKKALADAKTMNFNLIHLSCHGGEDGIALANNYQLSWDEFADLFQEIALVPQGPCNVFVLRGNQRRQKSLPEETETAWNYFRLVRRALLR